MKKQALTIGCVAAILLIFSVSSVFSWGSATHAYIGNKIGAKGGLKDFDEMYGSLAPDVFNYTFASYYPYLYEQTHYTTFNLKGVADEKLQKALAYGYFSHNGLWGADFTAHHSGITYGQGQGYVIAKATELTLQVGPLLESQGITLTAPVLLEVCHNFVEASVDILVTRLNPNIGQKLVQAGLFRTRAFPAMLIDVYAQGLADNAPDDLARSISSNCWPQKGASGGSPFSMAWPLQSRKMLPWASWLRTLQPLPGPISLPWVSHYLRTQISHPLQHMVSSRE